MEIDGMEQENSEKEKKLTHTLEELVVNLERIAQREKEAKDTPISFYSSKLVDSAAFIYEKVRSLIDYQDEHLLRRSAIERVIWRRINLPRSQDSLASGLVKELTQAGYIKNEMVSEDKISVIKQIVERYLSITKSYSQESRRYFIAIAAAEIEEKIVSHEKENALAKTIYKVIKHDLAKIEYDEIKDQEQSDKQLFIIIYRLLLKSDKPTIRYELFKQELPEWQQLNKEEHQQTYGQLNNIKQKIEQNISKAFSSPLTKVVQYYRPIFLILRDTIEQNPQVVRDTLENPKKLGSEVNLIARDRYKDIKEKLARGIVRAVLFIFLTKMIFAILLELPYDLYLVGIIHYLPLTINLIFPPLLMASTYFLIYIPDQKNTDRLYRDLSGIVYGQTDYHLLASKIKPHERSSILKRIVVMLYIITFAGSFALIIWLLNLLHYNLASGLIFFFFLSIVSFFAFRLRQSATELAVTEEKEGLVASFVDFLFLPFLKIGHWISVKFTNWNVFLFFLDFVIEAPFKTILEIIEHWTAFIRELKEEMLSKQ